MQWYKSVLCRSRNTFLMDRGVIGLALSLVVAVPLLTAHGAHACTIGPSAQSTPEIPAADRARAALKYNDLIAEITVLSRVAPSERGKQCRQLMTLDCTGEDADPRCEGMADSLVQYCSFDAAIRVQFGKIWKNATRDASDIIYVGVGGYPNQVPDSGGSCDSNPVITAGDSFIFCGSIDSDGALTGTACDHDALFDRVKTQRDALAAVVKAAPKNDAALGELAQFLENWGEVDAALAAYAKLRDLSPDKAVGYAGPGRMLYAKQRFTEAVPFLEQALRRTPGDANLSSLLAAARREAKYCAAMRRNPLLACRQPI